MSFTLSIHLFAAARDAVPSDLRDDDCVAVQLPENAVVADLREAIRSQYPTLTPILTVSMIAVDREYATNGQRLFLASEVAIIPPVSGG